MTNRTFKTGVSREQASLLPPCIEDYVACDSPVRAIDAFVDSLALERLGFKVPRLAGGAGQPPYHPADLLKLCLYGYLCRIRSSRNLAREAGRNLEVIWLMRQLRPCFRTISTFRRENWAAFKAAAREFVLMMRELDLFGGEVVAIDGAFFHGNASLGSIRTQKKLAEQLARIEKDIETYGAELAANDAAEEAQGEAAPHGQDIAKKVAALIEKRAAVAADLAQLAASGETQVSRTDPDARLLSKNGGVVAGYNVQIAVDDKHKLIVASEVVNDGNDSGQLYAMAKAAKEELGVETLAALADTGYHTGSELKACEEDGIVAYVPEGDRSGRLEAQGRLSHAAFVYEAARDIYRCPAGQALTRRGYKTNTGGRLEIRYATRKADCAGCALRGRCLPPKSPMRTLYRWLHEEVLDRHRARMQEVAPRMRRRGAIVEHPFGTLKCRAGYRHFLLRGFNKVRGEWNLMTLCYNFSRVLGIVGIAAFIAYCRKRTRDFLFFWSWGRLAVGLSAPRMLLRLFWSAGRAKPAQNRLRWSLAA
jgi:transposase